MHIAKVRTAVLDIACEDRGPLDGTPVVLLHGFPYDPRAFDEVVPILIGSGLRTIVPYLRGYGDTQFLSAASMRSGQQGAIGKDLLDLLDALKLERALLAGFDWGGRGACVVSALWPERVLGLVTCCGYQVQDIPNATRPADPEQERRLWYQYYFHTERGRAGLTEMRDELCRLLWKLWSPTWRFDDATFARTAKSFDNPDFVDVAMHSYRHRYGSVAGDPLYADIEARLAKLPAIGIPSIALHGADDDVHPQQQSASHEKYFKGRYERRVLERVGHNVPQEAPREFARAVIDVSATPGS